MSMIFFIRDSDTGVITGMTETGDSSPGVGNSEYMAWHDFPVSPAFTDMDDAREKSVEWIGYIVDGNGDLQDPPVAVPLMSHKITLKAFRKRLTLAEKLDIYTKATSDARIRIIIDDFSASPVIDLADSDVIDSVEYLFTAGSIDSDRKAELLAQIEFDMSINEPY